MARSTDASGMSSVNSNNRRLSTPDAVQDQLPVSDVNYTEELKPTGTTQAEASANQHGVSDSQPLNNEEQQGRASPSAGADDSTTHEVSCSHVAEHASKAPASCSTAGPAQDAPTAAPANSPDISNGDGPCATTAPARKPTPSRSKAGAQAVPAARGGGTTHPLPILPPPALTLVSSALLAAGGTVPPAMAGTTGRFAGTKSVTTAASLINAASAPSACPPPAQKVMRSSLSSCGLSTALAAAAAATAAGTADGTAVLSEGTAGSLGGRTASGGSSDADSGSTYSGSSSDTKGKAAGAVSLHQAGHPQHLPSGSSQGVSGALAVSPTSPSTAACGTPAVDSAAITAAVAASKLGLTTQLTTALGQHAGLAKARDAEGRACLHYAAGYGHEECVDLLLAKGAEPRAIDVNGDVPLHFAAIHGHPMCSYNIAKACPAACLLRNARGQTPIDVAVACGRGEVLNAMLLAAAGDGSEAAVVAMKRLLKGGAVPDTWAPNGSSALMLAASADATAALQVLLRAGAALELQDALGRSALMFAAGNCAHGALVTLLDAGAAIAARDRRGRSVLDYAPEGSRVRETLMSRLATLEEAAAAVQADLLASLLEDTPSSTTSKSKKKAPRKGSTAAASATAGAQGSAIAGAQGSTAPAPAAKQQATSQAKKGGGAAKAGQQQQQQQTAAPQSPAVVTDTAGLAGKEDTPTGPSEQLLVGSSGAGADLHSTDSCNKEADGPAEKRTTLGHTVDQPAEQAFSAATDPAPNTLQGSSGSRAPDASAGGAAGEVQRKEQECAAPGAVSGTTTTAESSQARDGSGGRNAAASLEPQAETPAGHTPTGGAPAAAALLSDDKLPAPATNSHPAPGTSAAAAAVVATDAALVEADADGDHPHDGDGEGDAGEWQVVGGKQPKTVQSGSNTAGARRSAPAAVVGAPSHGPTHVLHHHHHHHHSSHHHGSHITHHHQPQNQHQAPHNGGHHGAVPHHPHHSTSPPQQHSGGHVNLVPHPSAGSAGRPSPIAPPSHITPTSGGPTSSVVVTQPGSWAAAAAGALKTSGRASPAWQLHHPPPPPSHILTASGSHSGDQPPPHSSHPHPHLSRLQHRTHHSRSGSEGASEATCGTTCGTACTAGSTILSHQSQGGSSSSLSSCDSHYAASHSHTVTPGVAAAASQTAVPAASTPAPASHVQVQHAAPPPPPPASWAQAARGGGAAAAAKSAGGGCVGANAHHTTSTADHSSGSPAAVATGHSASHTTGHTSTGHTEPPVAPASPAPSAAGARRSRDGPAPDHQPTHPQHQQPSPPPHSQHSQHQQQHQQPPPPHPQHPHQQQQHQQPPLLHSHNPQQGGASWKAAVSGTLGSCSTGNTGTTAGGTHTSTAGTSSGTIGGGGNIPPAPSPVMPTGSTNPAPPEGDAAAVVAHRAGHKPEPSDKHHLAQTAPKHTGSTADHARGGSHSQNLPASTRHQAPASTAAAGVQGGEAALTQSSATAAGAAAGQVASDASGAGAPAAAASTQAPPAPAPASPAPGAQPPAGIPAPPAAPADSSSNPAGTTSDSSAQQKGGADAPGATTPDSSAQHQIELLEAEVADLKRKLRAQEASHSSEVTRLRKEIAVQEALAGQALQALDQAVYNERLRFVTHLLSLGMAPSALVTLLSPLGTSDHTSSEATPHAAGNTAGGSGVGSGNVTAAAAAAGAAGHGHAAAGAPSGGKRRSTGGGAATASGGSGLSHTGPAPKAQAAQEQQRPAAPQVPAQPPGDGPKQGEQSQPQAEVVHAGTGGGEALATPTQIAATATSAPTTDSQQPAQVPAVGTAPSPGPAAETIEVAAADAMPNSAAPGQGGHTPGTVPQAGTAAGVAATEALLSSSSSSSAAAAAAGDSVPAGNPISTALATTRSSSELADELGLGSFGVALTPILAPSGSGGKKVSAQGTFDPRAPARQPSPGSGAASEGRLGGAPSSTGEGSKQYGKAKSETGEQSHKCEDGAGAQQGGDATESASINVASMPAELSTPVAGLLGTGSSLSLAAIESASSPGAADGPSAETSSVHDGGKAGSAGGDGGSTSAGTSATSSTATSPDGMAAPPPCDLMLLGRTTQEDPCDLAHGSATANTQTLPQKHQAGQVQQPVTAVGGLFRALTGAQQLGVASASASAAATSQQPATAGASGSGVSTQQGVGATAISHNTGTSFPPAAAAGPSTSAPKPRTAAEAAAAFAAQRSAALRQQQKQAHQQRLMYPQQSPSPPKFGGTASGNSTAGRSSVSTVAAGRPGHTGVTATMGGNTSMTMGGISPGTHSSLMSDLLAAAAAAAASAAGGGTSGVFGGAPCDPVTTSSVAGSYPGLHGPIDSSDLPFIATSPHSGSPLLTAGAYMGSVPGSNFTAGAQVFDGAGRGASTTGQAMGDLDHMERLNSSESEEESPKCDLLPQCVSLALGNDEVTSPAVTLGTDRPHTSGDGSGDRTAPGRRSSSTTGGFGKTSGGLGSHESAHMGPQFIAPPGTSPTGLGPTFAPSPYSTSPSCWSHTPSHMSHIGGTSGHTHAPAAGPLSPPMESALALFMGRYSGASSAFAAPPGSTPPMAGTSATPPSLPLLPPGTAMSPEDSRTAWRAGIAAAGTTGTTGSGRTTGTARNSPGQASPNPAACKPLVSVVGFNAVAFESLAGAVGTRSNLTLPAPAPTGVIEAAEGLTSNWEGGSGGPSQTKSALEALSVAPSLSNLDSLQLLPQSGAAQSLHLKDAPTIIKQPAVQVDSGNDGSASLWKDLVVPPVHQAVLDTQQQYSVTGGPSGVTRDVFGTSLPGGWLSWLHGNAAAGADSSSTTATTGAAAGGGGGIGSHAASGNGSGGASTSNSKPLPNQLLSQQQQASTAAWQFGLRSGRNRNEGSGQLRGASVDLPVGYGAYTLGLMGSHFSQPPPVTSGTQPVAAASGDTNNNNSALGTASGVSSTPITLSTAAAAGPPAGVPRPMTAAAAAAGAAAAGRRNWGKGLMGGGARLTQYSAPSTAGEGGVPPVAVGGTSSGRRYSEGHVSRSGPPPQALHQQQYSGSRSYKQYPHYNPPWLHQQGSLGVPAAALSGACEGADGIAQGGTGVVPKAVQQEKAPYRLPSLHLPDFL